MFPKAAIILALIPALAAAQTCLDDSAFTFVTTNTGKTVNCDWLNLNNSARRKEAYCVEPAIRGACSISCDACPCEDTPGFTFTVVASDKIVGCDWFAANNSARRIDNYCIEDESGSSDDLYDAAIAGGCIDSCGLCTGGDGTTPAPTSSPVTSAPIGAVTSAPTGAPDTTPTSTPTRPPSPMPSPFPTLRPTNEPSDTPSENPSNGPSDSPSSLPSDEPSQVPTIVPSDAPSQVPTIVPSDAPSTLPSDEPSSGPSSMPSDQPSSNPSDQPSVEPSGLPSDSPTRNPSTEPSISPTNNPTASVKPSASPSAAPIGTPTAATSAPVKSPTAAPVASCADDSAFTFVTTNTGKTVKCDWLTLNNSARRIAAYCPEGPVLGNCLASCDNCSCAADPVAFTFTVSASGATVGCDWFGKRNTEDRRANYCVDSGEFYDKKIADTCVSGCFCG
eukprot:scaffold1833_cov263-Chaetoceros_neogracile.AAC.14